MIRARTIEVVMGAGDIKFSVGVDTKKEHVCLVLEELVEPVGVGGDPTDRKLTGNQILLWFGDTKSADIAIKAFRRARQLFVEMKKENKQKKIKSHP